MLFSIVSLNALSSGPEHSENLTFFFDSNNGQSAILTDFSALIVFKIALADTGVFLTLNVEKSIGSCVTLISVRLCLYLSLVSSIVSGVSVSFIDNEKCDTKQIVTLKYNNPKKTKNYILEAKIPKNWYEDF